MFHYSDYASAIGVAGRRLNRRARRINEMRTSSALRKNGAPGRRTGAAPDVKKLNSPLVKTSGEMMAVRLVREVNAPWIFPCSEGSTVPATSP